MQHRRVNESSREINCFRQSNPTMTGDEVELDSFFRKFLGLRKYGRNATLHMESRPDGTTFVNLQLEVAKNPGPGPHDVLPLAPAPVRGGEAPVRVNQPDVAVVVMHGDGDAPVPVRGGEAPGRDNQRDEHCDHFVEQHGGRNGRRPEKGRRQGIRSRERRRLRREAVQRKMEAEQASNDVESNETTEEVEMSKLTDDTIEEVHEMLKTTKRDAEKDASINEIEDEESTATIKDSIFVYSESLNDDGEELEKANKTIIELSKSLKMKEAELAETKACYRLYIQKAKSVIRSLEHDAVKRSEAEE